MRTRRIVAALGGLLLIALTGCGQEAGPKPKPGAGDPGPEALSLKLDALSTDDCFRFPAEQQPKGCEKYITELSNTSRTVRKLASPKTPVFTQEADRLDKQIAVYRDNACHTVTAPASQPCGGALSDLSVTLKEVKQSLSSQGTTG